MAEISAERVTGGYGDNILFRDLSFKVEEGEFWAILGPNGAGKSTLIRTILGLLPPISGTIYVFGCPAKKVCPHRRQVGYVPQVEKIDPSFPARVIDVVLTGTYGQIGLWKRVPKRLKDHANELIEKVGLRDKLYFPFGRLSIGQQKRVLIARALIGEPKAFILDEPLAGLDIPAQTRLMNLIVEVHRERKIPVIFVAHNLAFAFQFVDKILLLGPSFHAIGTRDILKQKEILRRIYGGPVDLLKPGDEHVA